MLFLHLQTVRPVWKCFGEYPHPSSLAGVGGVPVLRLLTAAPCIPTLHNDDVYPVLCHGAVQAVRKHAQDGVGAAAHSGPLPRSTKLELRMLPPR
ncbi:hypothetical protein MSG28_005292 [Choristoneura fumiferana]|uniref:Uncharacterized protein n=1 Tax=Choristoneura fumiferana TaxID=7141 RepID=A0ACC0JQN6_CHOFU|nr:hypothetical protein MSG28_005292 [Choristoneura fumiferana]